MKTKQRTDTRQETRGSRRILRQIERLNQHASRYLQDQLERLGVTDLEAHLLWHLRKEGRAVGELQQSFAIQPSTLTGVIDRLERRGYARRRRNARDRRSFHIELTAAGQRAAARVSAVVERVDVEVRRRVRESDLDGFFAVAEAVDQVVNVP